MTAIGQLSARFGVNAEVGEDGKFPVFSERMRGKRVLLIADRNTQKYAPLPIAALGAARGYSLFVYDESEPVADEKTVERAVRAAEGYDYLLAVGAGTLNDVAKRAGFLTGKPSGVFATAPSMDGFTSGVTPLIENGFKITRPAQVARDVLLDYSVLAAAPRIMLGAGVGDILAKRCCLKDWKLSSLLTGEKYNEAAASLMYGALSACEESIPALCAGDRRGVEKLTEALLVSGYAMVVAGNSRPASGAEHHMSHFLEMYFLRRGERIPLHGVKVGLGTAVSLYLYRTLKDRAPFRGCEKAYALAEGLPHEDGVLSVLGAFGCPTRFSELGVGRDVVRDMLKNAWKIRDRYTVLTLYCTEGLMDGAVEEITERFF